MTTTAYHAATIADGTIGGLHTDAYLVVDDATVVGIVDTPPTRADVVECKNSIITPGYIDIHCHGANATSYDVGSSEFATVKQGHLSHGTTRGVMSFVTASVPRLVELIKGARAIDDPWLLGVHPEGPFLAESRKGAHDINLLIDPEPAVVNTILDAADGFIRQITIAPERAHGLEAVSTFAEHGAVPAVGHTECDYDTAREAFDRGARILTHAFNAMPSIHHRAPGPVIAALRDPRIWIEVINDGVHVHPAVVRSLFEEASERMVLVTDAMAATNSPDGHYLLGELNVAVKDHVARLVDGGNIAGSTLTMDRAVARAITAVGVPLDVAVAAATSHPAAAINLEDSYGRLAEGYPADFLLLDPETYLPTDIHTSF